MVDHDAHNGGERLPPPHNKAPPAHNKGPPGGQLSETTGGYTFVGGVRVPANAGTFAIVLGGLTDMCSFVTMLVVMAANGLKFFGSGLLRHLAQPARVILIPQMIVELAVIAMVGVMFLQYLNCIDAAIKTLADINLQMFKLMLRRIM